MKPGSVRAGALQCNRSAAFRTGFNPGDKAVALPGQSFNEAWFVRLVRKDLAEFVHGLVQAEFEV